jgi:geranylgeranyl diphosphate synthase type II
MYYSYIKNDLQQYYNTINNSKIKNILQYSLEDGKCIRGFIVKHLINKLSNNHFWQPVVSIELIHGISLIIDDLPCMDNDVERRNKPSTFVKFGERNSLMVSFFGISEAFKILIDCIRQNEDKFNNNIIDKIYKIIDEWNEEIGKNLIIGQMLDLNMNINELTGININNNENNIIIYKTASLFSFAFILGAIFSNIDNIDDFKNMGKEFGIMFQLMDDYIDKETDNIDNNYFLHLWKFKTPILRAKK